MVVGTGTGYGTVGLSLISSSKRPSNHVSFTQTPTDTHAEDTINIYSLRVCSLEFPAPHEAVIGKGTGF